MVHMRQFCSCVSNHRSATGFACRAALRRLTAPPCSRLSIKPSIFRGVSEYHPFLTHVLRCRKRSIPSNLGKMRHPRLDLAAGKHHQPKGFRHTGLQSGHGLADKYAADWSNAVCMSIGRRFPRKGEVSDKVRSKEGLLTPGGKSLN